MVRHARLRLSPASIFAMALRAGLLAALYFLVVPAMPAGAAATSQSPVAEYSFDEDPGEGTTVEDLSGDGNTATIEGAEWVPGGRYGGAMKFDAAKEDRLSAPASEDLDLEEEFTLEAWVRPETEAEEYALILGKENSVSPHFAYVLYAQTPQNRAKAFFAEGAPGHLEAEGGSPAPRTWTHIAVTDDGAHSRLYVDGHLVDTAESVGIPSTDGDLVIGGNKAFAAFFDGKIDEVRIYNRPLDEAEIQSDAATPIETPSTGPVAEYSFDEKNEESAADLTGHGNTATVEGAEWVQHGKYGGAYKFDAAKGDVLTVPAAEDLDLTEEFTLEAWIKPESTHEFENILEKENSGEPGYSYLLTDHHDQLGAYLQEEPAYSLFSPGEEIEPHTWNHVALTYDGSRVHLYLNGTQVSSEVAPSFVSTDGALKIGGGEGLGGNSFDGKIDEVRIYNRALDGAELGADIETPIQTPRSGPVAAYAFDEGEGTTVEDVTGNKHPAAIEGEAEWAKGKYGDALSFLKEGDCASVADSPELRLTEEFTIEAWIRPDGSIYEDPVVVREAGGEDAFGLGIGSTEEGHAEAFIGEGAESETAVGGPEIREYEWVHLAATWDGAHVRLYVDGELAATEASTTPPGGGEGDLRIGCDTPEGPFGGRIDNVRVYDRALDGGEVVADMETPLQTPKATPVAKYSFDEKNEETAEDLSGDGHTAVVEGAKWTEHGRYGGAYEFDAEEGDVLKIPASEELDFDEEFTLEAWVRPSGEDNKAAPLIDKQEGAGLGYFLYEGGSVSDRPFGAVSEEQEFVHADDPLPAHAWSHVALTFTGNRTYLYFDGELVDNGAAEPVVTSEGELEVGGSTNTGDYFDGRIDEVRIYNRGLTAGEVAADMESPILTPKRGSIAAYSFDEKNEETAIDISLNGHDGAVEGSDWTEHGRYGGAYEFNGEEADCISVPNSEALQLTEELSVEAWVKPGGSGESEPIIFKESPSFFSYALYLGKNNPGHIEGLVGEEGSESSATEDPAEVEKNVWSQVDMTFDGAYLRLYVNGEEVDKTKANGPQPSTGQLSIGCSKEFGDSYTGRIDEVRLYDRALSLREIRERPEIGLAQCDAPNSRAASEPRTRELEGGGTETSYRLGEGQTLYTATPPPSFEPLTATAQELAEFGLPPKPSDPEMREEWEESWGGYQPIEPQASTAPCETELNTEWQPTVELEEESGEEGEEASSSGTLDHWSGYIGKNETKLHHFTGVLGAYIQPPSNLSTQCPQPREVSWVGLGGYGETSKEIPRGLIQAGTSIERAAEEPNYAWYEWLRGKPSHNGENVKGSRKIIKDPAFNGYLQANRLVQVYVTAGLDYGAEYGTSEHAGQNWALFQIEVEKTNGEKFGKPALIVPFNGKSFYNGETVEWIDERPGGDRKGPLGENLTPLQNFGIIPWSEAYAYTESSNPVPVGKLANRFRGVMKPLGKHVMTKPSRILGNTRFTDEWLRCAP
jgi:Concanavalin A-like lectin/glucanases superfamily/Peptidase A4 family